ncbi:MAG TPA: MarP family serine protease [Candidatus Saccharimonadia bacterium]
MNLLDIVIIVGTLGLALRGERSGFLRQFGSLGGFSVGLLAGAIIAPLLSKILPAGSGRGLLMVAVFFGVAIMFGGLGQTGGDWLSRKVHEMRLGSLDRIFGILFGVGAGLTAAWLLAATFARTAGPFLTAEIQTSAVLRALDQNLPPAPDVLSRLEASLNRSGLPRVFTGLEPAAPAPVTGPNAATVNAAAAAATPSMVRLESLGCGGIIEGTGFVVAPHTVVTNAHVVAGVHKPIVQDKFGGHRATVTAFDPDLDIAVLNVPELTAPALKLDASEESRGTVGAVLGYPGGGSLTIGPASVLREQTAVGRDIYGSGLIARHIYELQAVVRPGNSGGPVVLPDGTVIAVVFAMSTTDDQVAYALTTPAVMKTVASANPAASVSTGPCLAD